MVSVRKRAPAVDYTEPKGVDGLELGSDEEQERQEERPAPLARARATPGKPRAPKRSAAEAGAELDGALLLDIVKKHGTSIAVAAKDWVDRYKDSRGEATAELLTFLLQACGLDHVLSEDDVEEGEVDALKEELDKQAQEEGLEDHWRGGKAAGKAFRSNYLELWDKVVREAADADVALWDQYLLDRLASLLIALNTSVVRKFRFVATLTAAQLVTSWIHVSLALGEARDTAERQLAAEERKKVGGKAAQERCAAFRRTVDRCHSRVQELKSYTDSLFQGIFAHRFRDCSEEIRASVIEGVGTWLRLHPSAFLTDQYLKYIAWALSDKDARVRLASITALLALYSNPDNAASLADFTQRFAQRFGELFYDADERVAVKGVQLNTLLVRLKEAQPSQFARVYELLADESAAVRHAVAELVASALEEQGAQVLQTAAVPKSAGKRGQRRKSGEGADASPTELQLAGLLQVMHLLANPTAQQGGEEDQREGLPLGRELVAQVVDALFDRVPMLLDWALLLSWAQQGKAEEHFGEAGLTNLLHVLRDSLRKATGGVLVTGAADGRPGGKHQSKEKQQAQASARQDATLALMKDLPALLRKVQTEPAQAAALVGAVPEMKLEVYALKRQEKAFGQLADGVKDTFLKHADERVARECVAALAACAVTGPDSIKDSASLALSACATDVAAGLVSAVGALERAGERRVRAACDAFEGSSGEEEPHLLYDARSALVRLHALLALSGASLAEDEEVHDALHSLLESAARGGPLPATLVRTALLSQLLLLMWRLRELDPDLPAADAVSALASHRHEYVAQLEAIAACSPSQAVKDEVTNAMADCFVVFSASKAEGSALEAACFSPTDDTVHVFWQQCEDVLRREIEADEEEDAASIAAKMAPRRAAATKVAQLAVFQAVPQHAWLAAQLVSQWVGPEAAVSEGAVRRWAPVADVVKEMARLLKKTAPERMPSIYLEALKAAYNHIPPAPPEEEDNAGTDKEVVPEQEFLALSDRIAKTYAGFNSSASALEHIIVEGAKHALRQGPEHLPFLEGVAFFVRSLPAARAEHVRQRVEAAGARQRPVDGSEDWDIYFAFLECLAKRAAKGRVKSVLKKGAAGGAAGGGELGGVARAAPRKISFAAPRDAIEEASEEEDEEEHEAIEQADEEEERAGSVHRVLARSLQRSGGRQRSRLSGMSGEGGARSAGRHRVPAAAAGADVELEPSQSQGLAGVPEEDEAEEEEVEVLPTEEAMAIPGGTAGRSGGAARRKSRLQSLFVAEAVVAQEQVEEEEEEEVEEEDADLQNPFARRQAVVDEEPEAAEGGDDDDEEEERPVRRRRRH